MSTLIPSTRPVIGEDLNALREQLGMSTSEACWLFGMSMTKWTQVVKAGAKTMLKRPTLALLVRALNSRPDLTLLPVHPGAHDVFDRLRAADEEMDKKRLSIFFGSEASSGYRWITLESEISPALARLFLVFQRLYDRALSESPASANRMVADWRKMVEVEARERGIANIFVTGVWTPEAGGRIGRPVFGEDLDALREQMGLSTMDACWLFGLSMTKWTQVAKGEGAKRPLNNKTLALLVRALKEHPEVCPITPPPEAIEVYEAIAASQPHLDRKRMAIMFGCEASSGYRWLTTGSEIGTALGRLFKVFMLHHDEVGGSPRKAEKLIKEWDEMVKTEAQARGIRDVFTSGRWVETAGDRARAPWRALSEDASKALREDRAAKKALAGRGTRKTAARAEVAPTPSPAAPARRARAAKADSDVVLDALVKAAPAAKKATRVRKGAVA